MARPIQGLHFDQETLARMQRLKQLRRKDTGRRLTQALIGANPLLAAVRPDYSPTFMSREEKLAAAAPELGRLQQGEQFFYGQEQQARQRAAEQEQARLISLMQAELSKASTQGNLSAQHANTRMRAELAKLQEYNVRRARIDEQVEQMVRSARPDPASRTRPRAVPSMSRQQAEAIVRSNFPDISEEDLEQATAEVLAGNARARQAGATLPDAEAGEDPLLAARSKIMSLMTLMGTEAAGDMDALAAAGTAAKRIAAEHGASLDPDDPNYLFPEGALGTASLGGIGPQMLQDAILASGEYERQNLAEKDTIMGTIEKLGVGTQWEPTIQRIRELQGFDPQAQYRYEPDELGVLRGPDGEPVQDVSALPSEEQQRLIEEGYQSYYGVPVLPRGEAGERTLHQLDIIEAMPELPPIQQAKAALMQGAAYQKFVDQTMLPKEDPQTFRRFMQQARLAAKKRKQVGNRRYRQLQRKGVVASEPRDLEDLPGAP